MACARPGCEDAPLYSDGLCPKCSAREAEGSWRADFDHQQEVWDYYRTPWPERGGKRAEKVRFVPALPAVDGRGTRYGLAALSNIVREIGGEGGRNNAIFRSCARIGELIRSGDLERNYAMSVVAEVTDALCPDERWKAKDTAARGIRQGLAA